MDERDRQQLSESPEEEASQQDRGQPREFRGLYRYVKISVRTLDKIIVVGVIAILAVILFGVSHNGYTITFDSNGGTDVAAQELKYGEQVEIPDDPTREGYTFDGWYTDENWADVYDFAGSTVTDDLTLYARWAENE